MYLTYKTFKAFLCLSDHKRLGMTIIYVEKKPVLIMMTFSNRLAVLKVFWKKSWLIRFVIDSLIHVFAWTTYPYRRAEGQQIVHRCVLGITPLEPTFYFKIIVEDTRLIVYLNQVQFLHDKLLIFSIKFYITMFWKPSKDVLWFISIQQMVMMMMMIIH